MSAAVASSSRAKTPWHLWVVGIVSLLWNAMGAFDYMMTEFRVEAYMSQFTPEQLAFFYGFPAWLVACWAVAVWGGVLGSFLLLLRCRLAVWVFLASFHGLTISTIRNFAFADGLEMMGGTGALVFSAVIFLVSLLLCAYAATMAKRGVLA